MAKHRKHTPIVSERQRRFFGAEYGRAKKGESRETGMSKTILKQHLQEAGGKKLPERHKKTKKVHNPHDPHAIEFDYRKIK